LIPFLNFETRPRAEGLVPLRRLLYNLAMKLQFRHQGRQFFFVTLTLEGRPQALSRLVDAATAPELTPAGETALAVMLALHAVFPCATLSNRVIMPDHIHFLLIANYELMPTFNPLWVSFMIMEAIEAGWALKKRGQAPEPPLDPVALLRETVARGRLEAAEINRLMAQGLSRPEALAALHQQGRGGLPVQGRGGLPVQGRGGLPVQGRGGAAPVRSALRFDRRAYIELSFDSRQLKAIRHYMKLNPARALWKRAHPDRFIRFANIRHAILDPACHWSAMGNLTLLGSPFLLHARLTLKKTLIEHEPVLAEFVEKAKHGWVIVSGFISPGEVALLQRLKATPNARFIKLMPCSLPPRYDPSAEDSRELAADRLLILSGFTNTPHISPLAMRRDPAAKHLFRQNCLALNDQAAALCAKAQTRG